jgi:valine--pyruvate aminotransferase
VKLSKFGKKFARGAGIVELMEDLGAALNENPDMIFMGGGNPARIAPMEAIFKQQFEKVLANTEQLYSTTGVYQSPKGEFEFRREVAALLKRQFGWPVSADNIAVSNGSQSAFYILFNLLAGPMTDGGCKSIHLPLTPEYIGYSDLGLADNFFTATKPEIELIDNNLFKYHVDFNDLKITDQTAALCLSRPTNPTANVVTNQEIEHLDQIAVDADIPLIIDGAYGLPFPNITFCDDALPHWNQNTLLVLSLSKLGLPGVRTGIIVANEEIIQAYSSANTVINLACGNLGPSIAMDLFKSGDIIKMSNQYVKPFYQQRMQQVVALFRASMANIPYRMHLPEGAIFLWLWFEGLPITSQELYQRLKDHGVLVVPGHNFFPGIGDNWIHKHECIRVSYVQEVAVLEKGIKIIAQEVANAYRQG